MRLAAVAVLACACLPDPGGRCARDADCARGAAGSFCAEGICQGPPQGTVEVDARVFSRAESAHVRARVERSHGAAAARVVLGSGAVDAQPEGDGALGADVPLSLAPAGVEGPVPFSVELRDDLGHVTELAGSVQVDDRPPRVAVDAASVPSAPVVRGTQVSLRVTAEDLTAVSLPGATRNVDGSFSLTVDTRGAPAAATVWDLPVAATDAVGNAGEAVAHVPVTRLKYAAQEPARSLIRSLVLTDNLIWADIDSSELWILDRGTGAQVGRLSTGGVAFPEIATDGSRLFYARSDDDVCRMGADGSLSCCGPYSTLTSGPILQGTTAIVGTTGSSLTSSRLYALVEEPVLCSGATPSSVAADFGATSPGIGPDGIVYAGAAQAVVAMQFDGVAWTPPKVTSEAPRYTGAPAFRSGGEILLSTGAAGVLDTFAFTDPLGSPAPTPTSTQASAAGVVLSSPTIAADGTAVLTTDDRHAIALRPDGSVRWMVTLPGNATAPPTHGAGGLLYLGTLSGDVLALSLSDGSTVWSYPAGAPVRGPLAAGCDGVLYAAVDGAVLALVIDAPGLADSPWPKAAHDVRGTGDARRPLRSATGACLE